MFNNRRGTEDRVLGDTRMALRSIGVNDLEAIVDDVCRQIMEASY